MRIIEMVGIKACEDNYLSIIYSGSGYPVIAEEKCSQRYEPFKLKNTNKATNT